MEVQVYDEYVISGNTAVLRCQVPTYMTDFVLVTSWVQDDVINIYPGTESGKSKYVSFFIEAKVISCKGVVRTKRIVRIL